MAAPMSPNPEVPGIRGATDFRTTHWTNVLEAAFPGCDGGQQAFAQLYLGYWYPLYAFVRRRGYSPPEAEDITQDFFVQLITKESLSRLRREGGRFRSFLLRMLENFLANEWDRAHAQKRGGGQQPLSLNIEDGEARFALEMPGGSTPESIFERQWTLTLLQHVMQRLASDYAASGKAKLFDVLRPHLLGDKSDVSYAALSAECGLSEGAIKVTIHRMRQRYGQLLREEVSRTVGNSNEVDEELRDLIRILGRDS